MHSNTHTLWDTSEKSQRDYRGVEHGVRVGTMSAGTYCNLIASERPRGTNGYGRVSYNITFSPETIKALGRQIAELYPDDFKTAEPEHKSQEYRGNGKHDWEVVVPGEDEGVERLRVPGGWLYRDNATREVTFVPMPEVVKHKV